MLKLKQKKNTFMVLFHYLQDDKTILHETLRIDIDDDPTPLFQN